MGRGECCGRRKHEAKLAAMVMVAARARRERGLARMLNRALP